MPKSKDTIRREAHLMPNIDEEFVKIAAKDDRSVKYVIEKALNEWIFTKTGVKPKGTKRGPGRPPKDETKLKPKKK